MRELDAFRGLAFQEVTIRVRVRKGEVRRVVDGAGGAVKGGGLLAVLGPSGAGKTTLLSAIAGDVAVASGIVRRPSGVVAYCPQEDLVLPFLTVEETLRFAGELRLDRRDPRWAREVDRRARSDELLGVLGLGAVRGTKVGSRERRGVSGGERKRLAVGVELVLMPALLVADEPTSGLDSKAALEVARLLATITATVLASVHQPGAKVFAAFSDVLVLSPFGRPVYSGPSEDAAETVCLIAALTIPPMTSAAEFLLDAATGDGAATLAAAAKDVKFFYDEATSPKSSWHRGRCGRTGGSRFGPLLKRAWLNNARSPVATFAAFGRSVTMALLVGALYSGSRGSSGQAAVGDRTGALFFVLINQAFSAMASLRVFVDERAVFEHERKRDAYGTLAYFAAKSLAEVPLQAAFALLFAGLSYVLVGLRRDAAALLAHLAVVGGATLTAESLVLLVGSLAPDAKSAVVLCPVVLSTSLLFGGLFVSLDSLPASLKPLQALSLFKWSFAALLKAEFLHEDATFDCTRDDKEALARKIVDAGAPKKLLAKLASGLPCPTPDGETHLRRVLGDGAALGTRDAANLLLLFVLFRALAYAALARRTRATDVAAPPPPPPRAKRKAA